MFQVNAEPTKNLLTFAFSGSVTRSETTKWRDELPRLLAELKPSFKLLSDFSEVKSFERASASDIEAVMDLLNEAGVEKVVRIITHPDQDIGLSIMSLFHYRRCVSIITCQTMEEGLSALAD
jgi:hypothetical protein